MDGGRVLRIELDKDEDGKVDRWEYYGPDQDAREGGLLQSQRRRRRRVVVCRSAKVRLSASTCPRARDGKANRFEHYEKDVLVRAEEDTDGNGQVDKWETYSGSALASVAFDQTGRALPIAG